MALVKICGMTREEDALAAEELGADYVGFLFYRGIKRRYIAPEKAAAIAEKLTSAQAVALFVNEDIDEVWRIARLLHPGVLQFHGNESPQYCEEFVKHFDVWKARRIKDKSSLEGMMEYTPYVDGFVLDKHKDGVPGGTGEPFDWNLARRANIYGWTILAGGLTPENVTDAITIGDPGVVDVSTGVELEKGIKSYEKMKAFIDAAKSL